jgi:hypothetical protein
MVAMRLNGIRMVSTAPLPSLPSDISLLLFVEFLHIPLCRLQIGESTASPLQLATESSPNQIFQSIQDFSSQFTDHDIILLQCDIYIERVNLAIAYAPLPRGTYLSAPSWNVRGDPLGTRQ